MPQASGGAGSRNFGPPHEYFSMPRFHLKPRLAYSGYDVRLFTAAFVVVVVVDVVVVVVIAVAAYVGYFGMHVPLAFKSEYLKTERKANSLT